MNEDQQEKRFFSDSKDNVKDDNLNISSASNTNPTVHANTNKNFYIINQVKSTLLNKVTSTNNMDPNNLIK